VIKLGDTKLKTVLCELSDDQSFVQDNRQFADIPVDAAVTYQWKFMMLNTPEATKNELSHIRLGYSNNPHDLPTSLPDGRLLLYGGVVHCLPHGQTFSEPILLSFKLPDSVDCSQIISVIYSNTDVNDATHWTTMEIESWNCMHQELRPYQNKVILLTESRELQLVLSHFCIFGIVVDGKEKQAQKLAVDTFLKLASVSSCRFTIYIRVIVGCNSDKCVSTIC